MFADDNLAVKNFDALTEKPAKSYTFKQGKFSVQFMVPREYIVHCFVTQEKSGFDKMQRLYAACDFDEGKYFTLEMWCDSWEPKLDVSSVASFFELSSEV